MTSVNGDGLVVIITKFQSEGDGFKSSYSRSTSSLGWTLLAAPHFLRKIYISLLPKNLNDEKTENKLTLNNRSLVCFLFMAGPENFLCAKIRAISSGRMDLVCSELHEWVIIGFCITIGFLSVGQLRLNRFPLCSWGYLNFFTEQQYTWFDPISLLTEFLKGLMPPGDSHEWVVLTGCKIWTSSRVNAYLSWSSLTVIDEKASCLLVASLCSPVRATTFLLVFYDIFYHNPFVWPSKWHLLIIRSKLLFQLWIEPFHNFVGLWMSQ